MLQAAVRMLLQVRCRGSCDDLQSPPQRASISRACGRGSRLRRADVGWAWGVVLPCGAQAAVSDAGAGWKRGGVRGMRCRYGSWELRSDAGLGLDVRTLALPCQTVPRAGEQAVAEITADLCKENRARESNSSPRS